MTTKVIVEATGCHRVWVSILDYPLVEDGKPQSKPSSEDVYVEPGDTRTFYVHRTRSIVVHEESEDKKTRKEA